MKLIKKYSQTISGSMINIGNKLKFYKEYSLGERLLAKSYGRLILPQDSKIVYCQLTISLGIDLIKEINENYQDINIKIFLIGDSYDILLETLNERINNYNLCINKNINISDIFKENYFEEFIIKVVIEFEQDYFKFSGGWNILGVYENYKECENLINIYGIEEGNGDCERIEVLGFEYKKYEKSKGKIYLGLWTIESEKLIWNVDINNNEYILNSQCKNLIPENKKKLLWGILKTDISEVLGENVEKLNILFPENNDKYKLASVGIEISNDIIEEVQEKSELKKTLIEKNKNLTSLAITKDEKTNSLVVLVKNISIESKVVNIAVKDLIGWENNKVEVTKNILSMSKVGFIVSSLPKVYEITFSGDIDHLGDLDIWCGERLNSGTDSIGNSVFSSTNRISNKDLKYKEED